MSLKTHLLIVSLIIGVVFALWQGMRLLAPPQEAAAVVGDHHIQIARASWGMNCLQSTRPTDKPAAPGPFIEAFGDKPAKKVSVKENNILVVISALCDKKTQCSIRNHPDAFGFDPAPNCLNKEITIEYRCFSYDRPWQLTIAPKETGVIDCTPPAKPAAP